MWRQFFGEGKQLYTDRIGFKFADWAYHITTHAAPRPSDGGNRVVEVGQISRGLKSMAMELDVPVIALAQLNRQIENDGNRAPRLADLRESGSIESDSDVVGFIYCEDFTISDSDRLLCQLMVAKNRSGRTSQFDLCFHRAFNRFEDWRQHQDLVAMRDVPEEKPQWARKSA